MSWTNYHSHCHYCDGKYEPEKYIESALQQGLLAYGFSSHTPLPFETTWAMKDEALQNI
jgi:histidinol-phosphatase (PHP family)